MTVKPFLRKNNDPARVRKWLENQAKFFFRAPQNFWKTPTTFEAKGKSVKGLWAGCGKDNVFEGVLIYIHGGAFIFGSSTTHMKLAARIASALNFKAALNEYYINRHLYDAELDEIQRQKLLDKEHDELNKN